ncbi:glyoxalase [Paraoerskovia sediminicola]|uniref:Glyoxalase n=1 Tax=Paraoerskovia sediminicola TaxID=1138587 RepID=A0ABM8FZC2_9CELL|nr:VOC family protein [Paraoerskovia sediminicola]BDZ41111.1 glyoxalase [Paraoerskovia sediminicola]
MHLHHVQIACPTGGEDVARQFFVQALGMTEVEKPPALAARGGVWFRAFDTAGSVTAEIHVSTEEPFTPARRAHPALVLESREALETTRSRLVDLGFEVDDTERHTFDGYERLHCRDGHGNRVELLAEAPSAR